MVPMLVHYRLVRKSRKKVCTHIYILYTRRPPPPYFRVALETAPFHLPSSTVSAVDMPTHSWWWWYLLVARVQVSPSECPNIGGNPLTYEAFPMRDYISSRATCYTSVILGSFGN